MGVLVSVERVGVGDCEGESVRVSVSGSLLFGFIKVVSELYQEYENQVLYIKRKRDKEDF